MDRPKLDIGTETDRAVPPTPTGSSEARFVVFASDHLQRWAMETDTAVFDDKFEGGNLATAVRVKSFSKHGALDDQVYELTLKDDVCFPGDIRWWFFFSVSNVRAGVPYEFRITNLKRRDKMFGKGLHPVMFSTSEPDAGWARVGTGVAYHATPLSSSDRLAALMDPGTSKSSADSKSGWRAVKRHLKSRHEAAMAGMVRVIDALRAKHGGTTGTGASKPVVAKPMVDAPRPSVEDIRTGFKDGPFTLRFVVTFKHDNDTVFFAPTFPYTFGTLQQYLHSKLGRVVEVHEAVHRHVPPLDLAGLRVSSPTSESKLDVGSGAGAGAGDDDDNDDGDGDGGGAAAGTTTPTKSSPDGRVDSPETPATPRPHRRRSFMVKRRASFVPELDLSSVGAHLPLPTPDAALAYPIPKPANTDGIDVRRITLCRSVEGMWVEYVSITSTDPLPAAPPRVTSPYTAKWSPDAKPVLVFLARQHPGETVSSFTVQGILEEFLGGGDVAMALLKWFEIHVFPCVNPDGVINGNFYRSLSSDLNECWKSPDPVKQPEVYYIKEHLRHLQSDGGRVLGLFDIHSHSNKSGTFLYGAMGNRAQFDRAGCVHLGVTEGWRETCPCGMFLGSDTVSYGHDPHTFAMSLSRHVTDFDVDKAKFKVTKKRAGTARAVAWYELRVPLSVTLESSIMGSNDADLTLYGKQAVVAIADYFGLVRDVGGKELEVQAEPTAHLYYPDRTPPMSPGKVSMDHVSNSTRRKSTSTKSSGYGQTSPSMRRRSLPRSPASTSRSVIKSPSTRRRSIPKTPSTTARSVSRSPSVTGRSLSRSPTPTSRSLADRPAFK